MKTTIELPCNIGDTVYIIKQLFRVSNPPKFSIQNLTCTEFRVVSKNEKLVVVPVLFDITIQSYDGSQYYTRAEAEEALERLVGKQ